MGSTILDSVFERELPVATTVARAAGPAYRWVCSQRAVRQRIAPWLDDVALDDFSLTGAGLGPDDGLRRLERGGHLEGATVLVLGCGKGPEIGDYWLDRGAYHVVGVDLFAYPEEWSEVATRATDEGLKASFALSDGSNLGVADTSVDLVFSQSVLEHVVDLDSFLSECNRVLTDSGRFFAYFGPLWTTYGGPHVGQLGYDHLLTDDDSYLEAARRVGDGWEHWLEAGLFNRLRFDEYIDHIERHFEIERLGVVASRKGLGFRQNHPNEWNRLRRSHSERDLLTNLVSVIGKPRR